MIKLWVEYLISEREGNTVAPKMFFLFEKLNWSFFGKYLIACSSGCVPQLLGNSHMSGGEKGGFFSHLLPCIYLSMKCVT